MKAILLSVLIVPGLIVAYALILRPLLARIPEFAVFYSQANGFWAKVWAWCGNSFTILWAKIIGGMGAGLELLDPIATTLGDPGFKDQVTNALQANPAILGKILMGISLVTIAARVRGMMRGA